MAQPVDKTALTNLQALQRPGQPDFLTEMIDIFFKDVDLALGDMRAAVVASDAEALKRAGHSLKSSCAVLGAHGMAALALEIELLGRHATLALAPDALAKLEAEYALVKPILAAERRPG